MTGYKKAKWNYFGSRSYGKTMLEIKIVGENGEKLDTIRCNSNDFLDKLEILRLRWGFEYRKKKEEEPAREGLAGGLKE